MDFDFEFANSFIYLIQNFGGGTNSPHFWLGGVIAPRGGYSPPCWHPCKNKDNTEDKNTSKNIT